MIFFGEREESVGERERVSGRKRSVLGRERETGSITEMMGEVPVKRKREMQIPMERERGMSRLVLTLKFLFEKETEMWYNNSDGERPREREGCPDWSANVKIFT